MAKYKDADELLKRLNSCKYPAEKTTMRQATYNAAISDACRIVDAIPAVDIPRWITVTDRLPAYGEDVLLSMNGDYSIGYLVPTYDERQYEWHHSGWFYYFNEVDAWMPLPEPYKAESEG